MSLNLSGFEFRSTSKLKDRLDLVEDLFYNRKSHAEVAREIGITRSGVTHFVNRLKSWVEAHPNKDSIYRAYRGVQSEGLSDFSGELAEFKAMHMEMINQLGTMVELINIVDTEKRRPQWFDVRLRAMKMQRDFMADYWERFGHYVDSADDDEKYDVLKKRIDGFMDFLEENAPQLVGLFVQYLDAGSSDTPEAVQP